MKDAYLNAHMVHLPVHASWLNQVEIYFSVLQRKALTPDDFPNLDAVAGRLMAFQDHYNPHSLNRSTGPSAAPTSTNSSPGSAVTNLTRDTLPRLDQPRRN